MKNWIHLNYSSYRNMFNKKKTTKFTVNVTHPFSLFADDESSGLASNNVLDVSCDFISNTWSDVHNVAKSSCAPRMTSLEKCILK